ncbi:MAG: ABC transporter ATP-binding protein [Prevotella sp.]|jgi:ABC-2 type transport system ATP-binding protein|nr:ABC transporter ATP-binding protein [Prevotella sp.]MBP3787351.1 ABC transporter ATP-binding protein [Prevotella sp.]MBQ2675720.1 ABC transporter ATP-binding protein [Prevotella sp.]MBQ6405827.1 ABC transporter ATP-binding protein [Prevotella sp.]MBR1412532.1 ABC transporter ATP-binding protein [Prevotella sp.]
MITINNLKKQFGETCACDIPSFTINDGDILGLVGNNGAGKTTLFRLLLDLLQADEGSVSYILPSPLGEGLGGEAINPAESEAWKKDVGAYIDDGFLIDFLTPEEYFAFLGKISGMTQEDVDQRLEAYERFAGGEIFGQKKLIRNLSAGNKQKVGIISALLRKPRTVILDEPFNFLDPTSQLVLKHLITDYASETGATIIISSHNLQHTVDISTRIALLEHGQIIRDLPNTEGSATAELQEYFGAE